MGKYCLKSLLEDGYMLVCFYGYFYKQVKKWEKDYI